MLRKLASAFVLAFTLTASAQTPAPIVVQAVPQTTIKPFVVDLTPQQVAAIQTALATQGVTFPQGPLVDNLRVILKWDKAGNNQGATAVITFKP